MLMVYPRPKCRLQAYEPQIILFKACRVTSFAFAQITVQSLISKGHILTVILQSWLCLWPLSKDIPSRPVVLAVLRIVVLGMKKFIIAPIESELSYLLCLQNLPYSSMIFHQPVSCAFYLGGKFEFRYHLSRLSHRFLLHLERGRQEALRICVEE